MKKLFFSFAVVALMASCGGNEKSNANEDSFNEAEVVEEVSEPAMSASDAVSVNVENEFNSAVNSAQAEMDAAVKSAQAEFDAAMNGASAEMKAAARQVEAEMNKAAQQVEAEMNKAAEELNNVLGGFGF